ncbi:MAG TPA: hypothetical protein ENJ35_07170, partial [Gammaproteobacteria bacterium]|nr:hypothetical protein [Gammaproteobacteria bacterium]
EFVPVHVGLSHHGVSGSHSVAMLRPMNADGMRRVSLAGGFFKEQFIRQLRDCLADLDVESVVALLQGEEETSFQFNENEMAQLRAVAFDYRGYESSMRVIELLVLEAIRSGCFEGCLSVEEQRLMVRRVLQGQEWNSLVAELGFTGRKAGIKQFRRSVGKLLGCIAVH